MIVADAGLGGALETLAERPGVPVTLSVELPGRLPKLVEAGAYYVVDSPTGGGTTVVADIPLRWDETLAPNDPTDRRMRALKWIGWENHQPPGEILEQQTGEDNLNYGKAMLLAAGGNRTDHTTGTGMARRLSHRGGRFGGCDRGDQDL